MDQEYLMQLPQSLCNVLTIVNVAENGGPWPIKETKFPNKTFKKKAGVLKHQKLLQDLGRKAKLPWLSKRHKKTLQYIRPRHLVLMPVAHMLLHGLLKDLLVFALSGPVQPGSDVVFNDEQRAAVSVCAMQLVMHAHATTSA